MIGTSNDSTFGGWGLILVLLILFWMFGGNGWGRDRCGDGGGHCHQSERDVLQLATASVQQNASIEKTLAQVAYAQEAGFARVLDGQKDLYIRDLERIATQQFITSQTEALANKMDTIASMGALQRQSDLNAIQAQLSGISCQMLKAPQVTPLVGLGTLTCTNANLGCGNGCFG